MSYLRAFVGPPLVSSVGVLATGLLLSACASVELSPPTSAFVERSGLFRVQPGQGFRQLPPQAAPFDVTFQGPGGLMLAIVTSQPPRDLDELDRLIAERITTRAAEGRIIGVRQTTLSGLPARATAAFSTFDEAPLHTINLHTCGFALSLCFMNSKSFLELFGV